jgi:translation initiation factor IF-3
MSLPQKPRQQRRPPRKQLPHRINEAIRAPEVRLIDDQGEQVGILSRDEALQRAQEAGLDLVEIAPKGKPPVCRLLVYSKFLYDYNRQQRAAAKAKPKPPHELRMGPSIGEHDYETKRKQSEKFLLKGDKVKLVVQLKKRQNAHPQLGITLLERFRDELPVQTDVKPSHVGNRITILLTPDKAKVDALLKERDGVELPETGTEPVLTDEQATTEE